MNKQKIIVKIVLIVLTLIVVSLGAYFAWVKKSSTDQKTEILTAEENTSVKINYSGEWKKVPVPQNSFHSINTMAPATWKFDCCGDTESFSSLSIFPVLSSGSEVGPSIVVTEFVLIDCPNNHPGCSSEEALTVSPAQFMDSKTKELNADSQLTKKGSIKLPNFSTDVLVYTGSSHIEGNEPVELYLIQSPTRVVKIVFRQSDKFEPSFKGEFLNKLTAS